MTTENQEKPLKKVLKKNKPYHINFRIILLLSVLPGLWSCSANKLLSEGQYYYDGAQIVYESDSLSKSQKKELKGVLEPMLRPVPNKKILGNRLKVWFYTKAGDPTNEKSLRYWMKNKLGEAPVYMTDVNTERSANLLKNTLENNGFFQAEVIGDTLLKKKEGKAEYKITVGPRYSIRKVFLLPDSSALSDYINDLPEKSFLKPGDSYNFEAIKAERERIDGILKENGYYLFNADYVLMRVDSTVGKFQVDISAVLKRNTPSIALKPWFIDSIFIYADYDPSQDSIKVDSSQWNKNYYIIDPKNRYKPKVFDRTIFLSSGERYNRTDHNKTLNRLVNVGTFRFVRNRFEELSTNNDSGHLNSYYYLVNAKRRSARFESTAKTTSANFGGIEFNLSFRNRNTFKSAEQLYFNLFGGLDVQFGGQNKGYNIYRIGAEGGINWPRFVLLKLAPTSAFVPKTNLNVGYEWQQRQKLYTLITLRSSFGWAWKKNLRTEQEFKPFNITYVNSNNVTREYMDQVSRDSNLFRIIEQQLILGPSYSHVYTNTIDQKKKNGWYYKGSVKLSNNGLGLLQGAKAKEENYKSLLDVRYSQFVKTEHDLRFYRRLSSTKTDKQWVSRLNIGVGVPNGNSLQLPFIEQFFTGGSNSLRAFRVRSVGPGTYRPPVQTNTFLPDLVGDIKLELNTELRVPLFSIVKGAVFADAGNVWLFNENPLKPGAKFSSKFISEMAVGVGAGLRFDIGGIFLLRLDLGMPVRKPWLPQGNRWVFSDIEFGSSTWRIENLVFNLAVGLPF